MSAKVLEEKYIRCLLERSKNEMSITEKRLKKLKEEVEEYETILRERCKDEEKRN